MNPKKIRIVFMGTPDFAVESLRMLVENGYNVVGVVTAPDKPAGRGQKIAETAVKKYAERVCIPVLQPEKLRNSEFLEQLHHLKPDLQIVVAFRMLPEVVWSLPPLGTFNVHASLLPQYRGAAPINRAIMNGETETGVTTFLLDRQIDTGSILFANKIGIDYNDTAGDLHDKLMVVGAKLALKTVDALAEGTAEPVAQSQLIDKETADKHAPKLFRNDMQINWEMTAEKVRNLIRGLSPYPAAWTTFVNMQSGKSMEVKIFFAQTAEKKIVEPGTIFSDGKTFLKIACDDGLLDITELQLSGKKRMNITEFLRGFQNPENFRAKKTDRQ